ncbi:4-hydroxy-tetrahydrodipicolinate synthase [Magnetospirillum gryphiswaldense]|uniref:4-hydroxy-tetrahydrodipicolinate synthase n=1 Tax=Magnetospirillum gryphiswaldense TaxID=55518 RepID=A4U1M6_9PROT|nr:4-hydroxy-tetrahydrodipicolinate synthase [Magnetospirillum gryphiswaldense]AVM73727.1 4-hydroxy-tetrahydrodipicolinate synthase [Magnetospirillum gryphiswaldense MSR-1]AVM77630.1 4-hydroxy-tetrahydrodipicolinate synthase [Magnetospirillum gryphiswaldense]CAM76783.1 Dihydrodipicolinate synthetase [Magnetospirillum gryphiswaldense MSR-1]
MFKGSITALITPFRDGSVDDSAFQDFVAWQIAEGTHGVVPCGTTGESPTLSHDEHKRVVELCVEVAKGKVPVIAGTGSNSTEEAIALTRHAKQAGADAALVVAPYYNKPSQEGLFRHYEAIVKAVDLPVIVYNIPGRSVVNISVETFARLAKLPNIVGVKDATADLARPLQMRVALGDKFCQLSGEDATATAFNAQGGVGCISVTSNIAPRLCADMQNAWAKGDLATCFAIRDKLMPIHDAMFCETSPAPVKYAASLLGKSTDQVRLPLVAASDAARAKVKAALAQAGLI